MHLRTLISLVLISAGFALTLASQEYSTARAQEIGTTINEHCGHPRGSGDAKRVAKRAWSRPYGPTTKDRKIWHVVKVCARTQFQRYERFPRIWEHYKELLVSYRKQSRYELRCGDSPLSAVESCIEYASLVHNYSPSTLYRIASCESTMNPKAYNGVAHGLFQFLSSTWNTTVNRMQAAGEKIKDRVYSAKWNSLAAAWKMNHDGTGEWDCQ